MADSGSERFRVVIAGGGIAALEALLALRELAGDRIHVDLLAPADDFTYRPLSVGEPFRRTVSRTFSLWEIARDNGARFHRTGLREVDVEHRSIRTTAGTELPYDALLIAIGAQPLEGVPGALTFRGSADTPALREILEDAQAGSVRRLVFTMSDETWWTLACYELALLTRAHLAEHGAAEVSVELVTPEARPLGVFGLATSNSVAKLLHDSGVAFHPGLAPLRFEDGVLRTGEGIDLACDRVVALPLPSVPPIPGLSEQGYRGLIPTDRYGRVDGAPRVYAAGDATWFPIKQGGIAAQQADAAASAIAALAGAPVTPSAFQPVLRGALLTGDGPRFMRADQLGRLPSGASRSILWWPPSKVAGRLLAPYLFRLSGYEAPGHLELTDLAAPVEDEASDVEEVDEVDVREMALASADLEAAGHRYRRALRWLEVAEDLDLSLPPDYEVKRVAWQERARQTRGMRSSPAAPDVGPELPIGGASFHIKPPG
jgi:sulfide:quinone oxidoreductase